jgi:phytoene dehydrogenase-like protein
MAKLAADTEIVVVGSGPNGLAAAIEMARSGFRVRLLEASETVGGGTRTLELTLPGYRHDVCSAIHPLCAASPFYSQLPLEEHDLEWICPPAALAHPLDDGSAVLLERDLRRTVANLDPADRLQGEGRTVNFYGDWKQHSALTAPSPWGGRGTGTFGASPLTPFAPTHAKKRGPPFRGPL